MGWLAVVLAGLVDGLNPCAFATIIFFVSYLSLSGKKGKEILITGASFTVGVFIAYLLVVLGF
jgi:cytochrome c biogenesis protein CcdA